MKYTSNSAAQPQLKSGRRRYWLILSLSALVLISCLVFYGSQLFIYTAKNLRLAKIVEQSLTASINQYEYLPALLARDKDILNHLLQDDWNHIPLSEKLYFIAAQSGASDVFIQDIDGTVIASSNYRIKEKSFYGKNYAFRPYFNLAKVEEKQQFYFAKGATTGIPGFFISAPIFNENEVLGVAVVKISLANWERNWKDASQNIIVSDRNSISILSSDKSWLYRSIEEHSDDFFQAIYDNNQFPDESLAHLIDASYELNVFGTPNSYYWELGEKSYLVNKYEIPNINWSVYYLTEHRKILLAVLMFFGIVSLLAVFSYLLLRARAKQIELKEHAQYIERKRRAELQTLIDNIHIGVLVFDNGGRLLSMNDYAESLFAIGEGFSIDANVFVHNLIDINIFADEFDTYLQEEFSTPIYHESTTASHDLKKDGKKIPIIFSVGKVSFSEQNVYLMSIIDITRRKAAETDLILLNESLEDQVEKRTKELESTQATLMQKNKTLALGNMAATIVHELSQPLSAINSSVAAATSKVEKGNWSGATESLGRLPRLSMKMKNIIGMLKSYSYDGESLKTDVDLSEVVQLAINVLHDQLVDKGITVNVNGDDEPLFIYASHLKIDLVVSNLLKNAVDATEGASSRVINVALDKDSKQIILHIEDNGAGIDESLVDKLFTPYFTTKGVGKGMGLGLSIVYEVIQELGGSIQVCNTGYGAKFSVSIPAHTNSGEKIKKEVTTL